MMSWFPVDDAFHSHPKAIKAGDEAVGFWSRAGSYCMAYLTDGFVPEWWVRQQPRGMAKAKRLVAAELWSYPVEKDGELGFQFHQWKPECTKAAVEAARKKARDRKARSRESQGESRVTGRVTDTVSHAVCLVPTQPNPTQPINSLVTSGGRVTSVDANVDSPRPECPDHETNSETTNCIPCMKRRKWDKEHPDYFKRLEAEQRRRQAEARQAAIDACSLCDEFGDIEIDDAVKKCDHPNVRKAGSL
ncbi:replication initiation protein [Mycolicibacterium phage phi1_186001]